MLSVLTILDVLEGALDGELTAKRVRALSDQDLSGLAEHVNDFYDSWEPPPLGEGELRVYLGGWVAGNLAADEQRAILDTLLVYSHSAVMHDPVAAWFDRGRQKLRAPAPIRYPNGTLLAGSEPHLLASDGYFRTLPDTARSRDVVGFDVETLARLEPLIRSGVLIPVPHLRWQYEAQDAILTATRHDLRDSSFIAAVTHPVDLAAPVHDQIRGMDASLQGAGRLTPREEIRRLAENPSYYLGKTLAVAARAESRYVPPAATDWALLEARLRRLQAELRRAQRIELSVIPAMMVAELPFLGRIDPAALVAIRRDEDAFEAWRSELRTAVRTVESSPAAGPEFAEEARQALEDSLLPQMHRVREAASRTARLRDAAGEGTLNLALAGMTTLTAAGLGASPVQAAVPSGLSAAARFLWSATHGAKPTGAHAVLAHLERSRIV